MIARGIEDRMIISLPIIPLTAFEEFSQNDAMSRDGTAESGAVRARSVQSRINGDSRSDLDVILLTRRPEHRWW
jgi:hypothetical protein